jgi:thiol:disulfide interchange protein DsbD
MGAAVGYALSRPPGVALLVFAALGLGMSAPYVALSTAPGLGRRLPKPGRWTETLRQLLGFPMMAAVVWMLFVFAALAAPHGVVALVGALLAAGLGAWTWGRWGTPASSRGARIAAGAAALVLVLGATGFAVARASGAAPSPAAAAEAATPGWEAWSAARVDELRAQGRPVFIDFTARWCLTCQVNEGIALRSPQVTRKLAELGVVTLRADWTDRSSTIADALASYGRAGVPLYVYYRPGAAEPALLPEILTPGIVLAALAGPG